MNEFWCFRQPVEVQEHLAVFPRPVCIVKVPMVDGCLGNHPYGVRPSLLFLGELTCRVQAFDKPGGIKKHQLPTWKKCWLDATPPRRSCQLGELFGPSIATQEPR